MKSGVAADFPVPPLISRTDCRLIGTDLPDRIMLQRSYFVRSLLMTLDKPAVGTSRIQAFLQRLKQARWTFFVSFSYVLVVSFAGQWNTPAMIALFLLAVLLIDLAQVAVTCGYPHRSGFLAPVDTNSLPYRNRIALYVLMGMHWTVLMLVVFAHQGGLPVIIIWCLGGIFFGAMMGLFSEYKLRKDNRI